MGREREDCTNPPETCDSCRYGDHECSLDRDGVECNCETCAEARAEVEFYNGLEDFFKSIDPDRVGWETVEAEAFKGVDRD